MKLIKHLNSSTTAYYIGNLKYVKICGSIRLLNRAMISVRYLECILRRKKKKLVCDSAIIKAFAEIQHVHLDVDLLIAGDGPDCGALRELAESLAPGRVRMLGWVGSVEQRVHLYGSSPEFVGEWSSDLVI